MKFRKFSDWIECSASHSYPHRPLNFQKNFQIHSNWDNCRISWIKNLDVSQRIFLVFQINFKKSFRNDTKIFHLRFLKYSKKKKNHIFVIIHSSQSFFKKFKKKSYVTHFFSPILSLCVFHSWKHCMGKCETSSDDFAFHVCRISFLLHHQKISTKSTTMHIFFSWSYFVRLLHVYWKGLQLWKIKK